MTYTIRGVRETGTITYYCSTTTTALDKARDFRRAEYRDVTILTGDQQFIPEDELASLVGSENLNTPLR